MVKLCNQAKTKLIDPTNSNDTVLSHRLNMKFVIQRIGLYLAAAGILIWLLGGARRGFYVISEDILKLDPITEIEYPERHPKFLPGVESLFLGAILGGSFYLLSFLFSKPLK